MAAECRTETGLPGGGRHVPLLCTSRLAAWGGHDIAAAPRTKSTDSGFGGAVGLCSSLLAGAASTRILPGADCGSGRATLFK